MVVSRRIGGQAPHLSWFLRRLEAQGLAAPVDRAPPARLPPDWVGIELADCWLDLGRDGDLPLAERMAHCRDTGLDLVELAGDWLEPAAEHGFMLLVGNAPAPASAAWRVLDALAPRPGCWLHCGPTHSARFCQRVFAAMQHQGLSALPTPDGSPHPLDWEKMLQTQWLIAEKLRQLAEDYLSSQIGHPPPYPSPLPDEVRHFAANLARGILLTLPEEAALRAWAERIDAVLQQRG
ncbi:hypothetical protein [Chromobacterium sp. CV08]|uniref:hypothetical protein n=1 Tax=Chromobacterium sp. CV08 TaxID=3133274 RepID=UPI003DA97CE7